MTTFGYYVYLFFTKLRNVRFNKKEIINEKLNHFYNYEANRIYKNHTSFNPLYRVFQQTISFLFLITQTDVLKRGGTPQHLGWSECSLADPLMFDNSLRLMMNPEACRSVTCVLHKCSPFITQRVRVFNKKGNSL